MEEEQQNEKQIRKQKQRYLRQEIRDKGYDQTEFLNFCETQNQENGLDINNWTIEQLKEIVENFQNITQKVQEDQKDIIKNQEQPIEEQQQQRISESVVAISQIVLESNNNEQQIETQNQQSQVKNTNYVNEPQQISKILNKQFFGDNNDQYDNSLITNEIFDSSITSRKLPLGSQQIPESGQIFAEIKDHVVKDGGFFSSDYVMYNIVTQQFNWQVQRRFNDFQWLGQILQKQFPYHYVAPVASKGGKNLKEGFIQKRQDFLERMLNEILVSNTLRNSRIVQDFLSLKNYNVFKEKMKELNKIPPVQRLKEVYTLSGSAKLQINPKINNFIDVSQEFFQNSTDNYKKIKEISKQVMSDFNQLSSSLIKLSNVFKQQFVLSMSMNNKLHEDKYKLPSLPEIYENINLLLTSWGKTFMDDQRIFSQNFENFFKYQQSELKQILNFVNQRSNLMRSYQKTKRELILKKEKLFEEGIAKKWMISQEQLVELDQNQLTIDKQYAFRYMLPKVSNYLFIQMQIGFLTTQIHEIRSSTLQLLNLYELYRTMNYKCEGYSQQMVEFCNTSMQSTSNKNLIFANQLKQFAANIYQLNQEILTFRKENQG